MLSGRHTLAILLGASEWPEYPALDASTAFKTSVEEFTDYLRSRRGLRIPEENIKDLFDVDLQPGPLINQIRQFVQTRLTAVPDITDVILYYVGHGAYLKEREYFLAIKATSRSAKEATILKVSYLRDVVSDLLDDKRTLIVLDACYSGAALTEFVHGSEEDAVGLLHEQVTEGLRAEGTVLFCAAGPKKWAKTPLEATYTMFSGALIEALENGDERGGPHISLKRLAQIVDDKIKKAFGSQAVKPQIHVPVQQDIDVLEDPYFPNPAFNFADFESRISFVETTLRTLNATMSKLELSRQQHQEKLNEIADKAPTLMEENSSAIVHTERLLRTAGGVTLSGDKLIDVYRMARRKGVLLAILSITILGVALLMCFDSIGGLVLELRGIARSVSSATPIEQDLVALLWERYSVSMLLLAIAVAGTKCVIYQSGRFNERYYGNAVDLRSIEYQELRLRDPLLASAIEETFLDLPIIGTVTHSLARTLWMIDLTTLVIGLAGATLLMATSGQIDRFL